MPEDSETTLVLLDRFQGSDGIVHTKVLMIFTRDFDQPTTCVFEQSEVLGKVDTPTLFA